ncbi:anion exchange protein 4 isoform X7 [Meles meles]|uniref:anion exchange protein 4 isoform X7 n=1 Tax=Meles meles TaxID=9662 RepID=UPI001E69BF5F|nr:anion exchange protein 4 isoform X7 [Meles meles]
MKLPGQEEFEVSSACENVPTEELDSGTGSGPSPNSPSDTDRGELGVPKDPLLFIQLNELLGWPQALEWRETGRWVLFEEKLEAGAGRWSVPHVPTLALPSLQKLRSLLAEGLVLLDCPVQSFLELVEQVTRVDSLSPELRGQLQALLLQRPQHLIQPTGTRPCQGSAHPREASHSEEAPLKEQRQNPLRRKLPPGAEAGAVLAGELGFLVQPLGAFVRLRDPVVLGPLIEVPLPSRFFCLLLGPSTLGKGYHEMGRAMAVLLSDPQFQWSVRRASNLHDLLAALDAFLEEVTVLPPGRWDPTARIAPPKCLPSQHKRILSQLREVQGPSARHGALAEDRYGHRPQLPSPELQRTGRLFGGLIQDVRRKASWYPSDFLDALHPQCLSAVLYIYLATVTNAITFGGLLGEATNGAQGVLESFLGTAVAGAAFCLMAGQPLTILSSTGPVLVFERLLFSFSRDYNLDYLPFRLWVGIWVATFCLVLVATEASVLVRYFTRFTEEGFCALISLIFIYDAVGKMLSLTSAYPIQSPGYPAYGCFCQYPDLGGNESQWMRTEPKDRDDISSMDLGLVNASLLPPPECAQRGGRPRGPSCHAVPDIAFFSLLLFLTSFLLAIALKYVKTSHFFPSVGAEADRPGGVHPHRNFHLPGTCTEVHPNACALWHLLVHGSGSNWQHSVHKEGTAITDASKTTARPPALAACTSEQGPPLHSHPACLPGSALDNQVYPCSHHLSPHGDLGQGWVVSQGSGETLSLRRWPKPPQEEDSPLLICPGSAWLGILGQRKIVERYPQIG